MTKLNVLLGAAAAAATMTGVAHAETTFTGNVALTTDYAFRGISQTNEDPAIQGGFDVTSGTLYAGTWASNIDFGAAADAQLELDVYGGWKPVVGPVTLDLGVIGYLYPGAKDHGPSKGQPDELDYWELKAGASFAPVEGGSLGAVAFYSPEFTAKGGDGLYLEANGGYTFSPTFSVSGAVGHQQVDKAGYFVDGTSTTDNYTTWNLGGTLNCKGFGFDLRYVDTNLDTPITDSRVIFSIKRAL